MIRSPGSSRMARPRVPEEAELKLALLGVTLEWDFMNRQFAAVAGGKIIANLQPDFMDNEEQWGIALAQLADLMVKARVPVGHTNITNVGPIRIEAASVIDVEEFNG